MKKEASYPTELSADPEFKETVEKLVAECNIEEIVETGTYCGTGSTLIFAETKLPVFSIECNAGHVAIAKKNLRNHPNVAVLHGHSLKYREMLEFIYKDTVYEKKPELKREGGSRAWLYYLGEISCRTPAENLLVKLIGNNKRQLVLLDSSGGVGYLEFQKFMRIKHLERKVLMLDDVRHVKHYRSVQELKNRGVKFHFSDSKRWGWARF